MVTCETKIKASALERAPSTLLVELLQEAQSFTAVEQFARLGLGGAEKPRVGVYRDILPASPPGPGQQYAFEVDLDQCSGCKACVTACHGLNGLEEGEAWRRVGSLVGDEVGPVHVTTACHHCVDPECLNGCPVLAYDKDPFTGIVRHLDDQCIGCQYCVMMCPYEVPRYSERLGIVRKCDLCHQRLEAGEAPACVQACPNQAIAITLTSQEECLQQWRPEEGHAATGWRASFLPTAPSPALSLPTTTYKTARHGLTKLRAADQDVIRPAAAHWPLVWLLVLSQLSVGLVWVSAVGAGWGWELVSSGKWAWASFLVLAIALSGAGFHLGKPFRAWKAFLGWRRSWFSREVLAFGFYGGALGAAAASEAGWMNLNFVQDQGTATAAALGLLAVFCSIMIYVRTGRRFWAWRHTAARFMGTAAVTGLATSLALGISLGAIVLDAWFLLAALMAAKLIFELAFLRHGEMGEGNEEQRVARLMTGALWPWLWVRMALGWGGGVLLPLSLAAGFQPTIMAAWVIAVCVVAGETLERSLFFRASAPDRMPGAIRT